MTLETKVPHYQHELRPKKVSVAIYLLIVSASISYVFSIFNVATNWDDQSNLVNILTSTALFGLSLFIIFKLSVGRNWARWWVLIGFILMLLGLPISIMTYSSAGNYPAIVVLAAIRLLELVAVGLLVQRQSRNWFKLKSRKVPDDSPFVPMLREQQKDNGYGERKDSWRG